MTSGDPGARITGRDVVAVKPHRNFDPRAVGALECRAWMAYYRREWWTFLRSAIALTRHTFGLPWWETLYGAWLVLRANQLWAPHPHNDPEGARRAMQRFYGLVRRRHREAFDPEHAAVLEVEWWRVHRERQHAAEHDDARALVGALTRLYAYTYGVPEPTVRRAAEERAAAMDLSDRWVRDGCVLSSPLVGEERTALVRSYAALLAAVHRA